MVHQTRAGRRRARRGWPVIGVALVVPLTTGSPAAQGAAPVSVRVPQHEVPAEVTLIGASTVGVAVSQEAVAAAAPRIYTGAEGTELALRPALLATPGPRPAIPVGVVGRNLAWYTYEFMAGHQFNVAHRLDLISGQDTVEANSLPRPAAYNGESWFSQVPGSTIDRPENWDWSLKRIRPIRGESPSTIETLVPKVPGVTGTPLAADRTGVLRLTSRQVEGEPERYAVDLVDLRTKAVARLTETEDPVTRIALTDDDAIWVTDPDGGPAVIHRKPRAGGVATTHTEPDENADLTTLAAGRAGVGYLVGDGATLRVLHQGAVRDVPLPYGGNGLAAVGDRFLTAAGGDPATAGVYAVAGGTVSRVATLPGASHPTEQWSLSASQLRYAHQRGWDETETPVRERTVTGNNRPAFSAERTLPTTTGPVAFSAGRGVVAAGEGTWQVLDRGLVTARIEAQGSSPNISGSYVLIGGRVFRPDGTQVYAEPEEVRQAAWPDDIFGSTLVYSRIAGDGSAQIWKDDAASPAPVRLGAVPPGCGEAPLVSVWGTTVAWVSACGESVTVRDLRLGTTRTVPATPTAPRTLTLSEGTLTWVEGDGGTHLLDLTSPASVPTTLPDRSSMVAVDDHWLARNVRRPGPNVQDLRMSPLPFRPKYAPRLISQWAPAGFSPDGDGRADTWTPQFDVTKPLRSAELKITNGSGRTTVASLMSPAPDGSVRGLSWNGTSTQGVPLPAGLYRWTLTGRAADGDGKLTAQDGTPTIQGTVRLDRF